MIAISYVLPIRSDDLDGIEELTSYLHSLDVAELIIVDGSPAPVFAVHAKAWPFCRHLQPDRLPDAKNGKVRGVLTGLRVATCAKIVVADDDVRFDDAELSRVASLLDSYDLVRPQNYFEPLPWHALLDTSRTLINRATGGDWPGTLGFRRDALPRGYRGDVLFENLEMTRTIVARGGRELVASDLFVRRLPPTAARFWSQRVRQAYDEWARPGRLALALAVAPLLLFALAKQLGIIPLAVFAAAIAVAELGRQTRGGVARFPALASLLAPIWLLERAVCAWVAVYLALIGGVRYNGERLQIAASSLRSLREACE